MQLWSVQIHSCLSFLVNSGHPLCISLVAKNNSLLKPIPTNSRIRKTLSMVADLRTAPTIVIAHTFCASRDTLISNGWYLLIQGYFCAVWNYPEIVGLGKYSEYPTRNLGVTIHFWEIIKLQFEKERHTLLCILKLFTNIIHQGIHQWSLKNAWLPPIFFLDLNNTC